MFDTTDVFYREYLLSSLVKEVLDRKLSVETFIERVGDDAPLALSVFADTNDMVSLSPQRWEVFWSLLTRCGKVVEDSSLGNQIPSIIREANDCQAIIDVDGIRAVVMGLQLPDDVKEILHIG
jgi:hypothetical protein